MGELKTNGYYNPVHGSDKYLSKRAFNSILRMLEVRGSGLPEHQWGSSLDNAEQAEARHLEAVEVALALAEGPDRAVFGSSLENYFNSIHRLRTVGRGLVDLAGSFLDEEKPGLTDYYRFVQGYPIPLVAILSTCENPGNYFEVPPFMTSLTLGEMLHAKPEKPDIQEPQEPTYGEEERLF